MNSRRIIVVGGGAAGFFAAITCAETSHNADVTVLERGSQFLSKVRISGGGRCNVTHACFDSRELSSRYPRGERALLGPYSQFQASDTVAWFESRGVKLKTESDGRFFPVTDSSQTIIDCLLQSAREAGVKLRLNSGVERVARLPDGRFEVVISKSTGPQRSNANPSHENRGSVCEEVPSNFKGNNQSHLASAATVQRSDSRKSSGDFHDDPLPFQKGEGDSSADEKLFCDRLLLATGGCRAPVAGKLAVSLGHTLEPPVPSLFTFQIATPWLRELAGISIESVEASIPRARLRERGALLVTHWGLSGPVILRLSAWGARALHEFNYQFPLHLNWLPHLHSEKISSELEVRRKTQPSRFIVNTPIAPLPSRLWAQLTLASGLARDTRWSALSRFAQHQLVEQLIHTEFQVTGKSLNKDEFVTCGGVRLGEINFKTMESRICPGLYLAGELLDIDGITGGFNFQSAWTTGWIAGRAMATK